MKFNLDEQLEMRYIISKRIEYVKESKSYMIKRINEEVDIFNKKDIESADKEISILEGILVKIK